MINEDHLKALISGETAEFKLLVKTYIGEALFFEKVLRRDLSTRPEVKRVIEVGAGVGLLALLLSQAGYEVVAFEPESAGFSEMQRIRGLLIKSWDGPLPEVTWVDDFLGSELPFGVLQGDYGFALNVLEHVPDTESFLRTTSGAVKVGAPFRMIFPNYAFPYEPHFNFPTLFSKRLTERVVSKKINASTLANPRGMWNDLSWPTLPKVRRSARKVGLHAQFSRTAIAAYLERIESDSQFLERKGAAGRYVFRPIARLGRILLPAMPKSVLPILDVTFSKR